MLIPSYLSVRWYLCNVLWVLHKKINPCLMDSFFPSTIPSALPFPFEEFRNVWQKPNHYE